jgi:hypothetical protein
VLWQVQCYSRNTHQFGHYEQFMQRASVETGRAMKSVREGPEMVYVCRILDRYVNRGSFWDNEEEKRTSLRHFHAIRPPRRPITPDIVCSQRLPKEQTATTMTYSKLIEFNMDMWKRTRHRSSTCSYMNSRWTSLRKLVLTGLCIDGTSTLITSSSGHWWGVCSPSWCTKPINLSAKTMPASSLSYHTEPSQSGRNQEMIRKHIPRIILERIHCNSKY